MCLTSGQEGGSEHGSPIFPLEPCAGLEQLQAQLPGLLPAPCQAAVGTGADEIQVLAGGAAVLI